MTITDYKVWFVLFLLIVSTASVYSAASVDNIASGEAIVRQILYAKRNFREKPEVEPRIYCSTDTLGVAWSIPQILVKSDISYCCFMGAGNKEPVFWWEGLDGSSVLVFNDELSPIFTGCYTAHSDIKLMNRTMENLLPTAEAFSVIASAADKAVPYPSDSFLMAWQNTCFNQSHDIFEKSFKAGTSALDSALSSISLEINTEGDGDPVVVFNPLSWVRTDVVEIDSPYDTESTSAVTVTDGKNTYPAQIVADKIVFTARGVPALGYKVYHLKKSDAPAKGPVISGDDFAENEFFRVRIDPKSGTIAGIYDKLNNREIAPKGKQAGLLQALSVEPSGMSAWNIGRIIGTKNLDTADETEALEAGPVRGLIRCEHSFGKSSFVQDITIYEGVPRIDIKMTADWQEIGNKQSGAVPMIKVAFPTALKDPKANFDIPFGNIEHPSNGDETPALNWIDLSDDNYGVSILNNCKYSHDVKDGVMRISLIRASHEPDPVPDQGMREMMYSIYPHTGDWRAADTPRRAYELNNPLIAVASPQRKGTLPRAKSFVSVEPSNLIVTAFKQSEDGKGIILRFYEAEGQACNAFIETSLPVKTYTEVNLMERPVGKPKAGGKSLRMPVGRYEIKTLKLEL